MFAEVIVPVPLSDSYTYSVPPEMESAVSAGFLVNVPFGKRSYTGMVAGLVDKPPSIVSEIKTINTVETEKAVVTPMQLKFWRWISEYYLCPLGLVYQAAFPTKLAKKQIESKKPSRTRKKTKEATDSEIVPLNQLTEFQQFAYNDILNKTGFAEKTDNETHRDVCLLHGVTSSGKTEVYTYLINDCLNQNRQALYLLPEIALTAQITSRLKKVFGDNLIVYHSRITDTERNALWNRMLASDEPIVILGVRSSIFLPFRKLGLVIVDEEHEPSYKQQEPAPKYHARNAAIVLAKKHGAKTILGSATPCLESYHNAQTGKYAYVKLETRFEETPPPSISPVDVKELRRKKQMKGLFSPLLKTKMQETLDAGRQVLLFQNRRGFSSAITCKMCDWTPRCRYCDVSLSFHKQTHRLSCHYCGRVYAIPRACPECGYEELQPWGFGTEKVEEEVRELFPDAEIARMDFDTTKKKQSAEEIIANFESGKTQILIGTQMISKGLDFERVDLAGILSIDSLMNQPDFRAHERTFQLVEQVSGRTGRRKTQGEVVLQLSRPDSPLIAAALTHDYKAMAEQELEERRLFRYPPFYRLIYVDVCHRKEELARDASIRLADLLRISLGDRVAGPDRPSTARIQNLHIRRILLKIENNVSPRAIREIFLKSRENVLQTPAFRSVSIMADVDPM